MKNSILKNQQIRRAPSSPLWKRKILALVPLFLLFGISDFSLSGSLSPSSGLKEIKEIEKVEKKKAQSPFRWSVGEAKASFRQKEKSEFPLLSLDTQENLPEVSVSFPNPGEVQLHTLPEEWKAIDSKVVAKSQSGETLVFSLLPALQEKVQKITDQLSVSHAAVVLMDPASGQILAFGQKGDHPSQLAFHAGFPAASLFKLVTAAAAIQSGSVEANTVVPYRGPMYELTHANYRPNSRRDNRRMTLTQAMAASCNPVFSRLALQYTDPADLRYMSEKFFFNSRLTDEFPLPASEAEIPETPFPYGRTAAGFGSVYISPVHAAVLASAVATKGIAPAPWLVREGYSASGEQIYSHQSEGTAKRILEFEVAEELQKSMQTTTVSGTASRSFGGFQSGSLKPNNLVAKTGTLSGPDPAGLTTWFVGAGPVSSPQIAVAAVAVNARRKSSRAIALARRALESVYAEDM